MDKQYKKMLSVMVEKEEALLRRRKKKSRRKVQKEKPWFLYILQCKDGTLYTGITKDIEQRFKMHSKGKAARYTRTRLPLEVVYQEPCTTRAQALMRECFLKAMPKIKKLALIEQFGKKLKRRQKLKRAAYNANQNSAEYRKDR